MDPELGQATLQMCAELMRYTLALSTGALVFSTGLAREVATMRAAVKWLLVAVWLLLSLSTVAGILALARMPVMMSERNFDLMDPVLMVCVQVHQVGFLLGIVALGVSLVLTMTLQPPAEPPRRRKRRAGAPPDRAAAALPMPLAILTAAQRENGE